MSGPKMEGRAGPPSTGLRHPSSVPESTALSVSVEGVGRGGEMESIDSDS